MAKPKEGDTRGWNAKTGTGYKWKGGRWIQYKNNKPHGPFKGRGGITGNVDVVGGLKTQGGRLLRTIAGLPSDKQVKEAQEAGKRYRANNKKKNKPTAEDKKNKKRNKLNISFGDAVKASGGKRLVKGDMKTTVPGSRDFSKKGAEGKTVSFKKAMEANKDGKLTKSKQKPFENRVSGGKGEAKKERPRSTVFTKHYKTGKELGVMTRAQRRAYEKEAGYDTDKPKTFEGEVSRYAKESGHGKAHKRETLYKASQRKKKPTKPAPKGQSDRGKRITANREAIQAADKEAKKRKQTEQSKTNKEQPKTSKEQPKTSKEQKKTGSSTKQWKPDLSKNYFQTSEPAPDFRTGTRWRSRRKARKGGK